jgi:hypothetical protein
MDGVFAAGTGAVLMAATFALFDEVSAFADRFIGAQFAITALAESGAPAEEMDRHVAFLSGGIATLEDRVADYVFSYQSALDEISAQQ